MASIFQKDLQTLNSVEYKVSFVWLDEADTMVQKYNHKEYSSLFHTGTIEKPPPPPSSFSRKSLKKVQNVTCSNVTVS
jgi:hypothetical protein